VWEIIMSRGMGVSVIVVEHEVNVLVSRGKILGSHSSLCFDGLVIPPFVMLLAVAFPLNLQLEAVLEPLGVHKVLYYPLVFSLDLDQRWWGLDSAIDGVALCPR
jgi:hypothetical protein